MNNINLHSYPVFQELLSLELDPKDYVVFGSAPMWLHGLKELSHDIDVFARGSAWKKASQLGNVEIPESGVGHVIRFFDNAIEIFDKWWPGEWDGDQLIDQAQMIDGVRFASLEAVVEWKTKMGREKDLRDIQTIQSYWATNPPTEPA